jgi:hypothetical protein
VATDDIVDTLGRETEGNKRDAAPLSLKDYAEELRPRAEAEGIGLVGRTGCSRI